MKNNLKFVGALILGSFAQSLVYGDGCIGGTPCQVPGPGSAPSKTITAISVSATNSQTATANHGGSSGGSAYWFVASQGAFSTTPDLAGGTVVLSEVDNIDNPSTPGDSIGVSIDPVVGGTLYNLFVIACPPGAGATDSGCSAPRSLGSITTDSYPGNPGFLNVASADTAPRQFTAKVTGVQDSGDITGWFLRVNNNDVDLGAGNSGFLTKNVAGLPLGAGSFSVTSADYAGLLPNVGYTLTEQLRYKYNKLGGQSTTATFFTQPEDPVAGSVTSISHCSATLSYSNTAASTPNPSDSPYTVDVHGAVSSGSSAQTNNIGTTTSVTFSNLNSHTTYTPTVQVQNRGGGSWLPSASIPYSPATFQTDDWGSVTVQSITATQITLNTTGIIGAGTISSWQVTTVPALAVPQSGSGVPPSTINLGVVPNTSYNISITLTEGASSCQSTLLVQNNVVTPAVPVASGSLSVIVTNPRALLATWTDTSNSASTQYKIDLCPNGAPFGDSTCLSQTVGHSASPYTFPGLTPETPYTGRIIAVAIPGGTNSSATSLGSATTPNEKPVVDSVVKTPVTSTSYSLVATAHAHAPLPESTLVYHWSFVSFTGTGTSIIHSFSANNTNAAKNATFTFDLAGTYNLQLIAEDHNGDGSGLQSNAFAVQIITGRTPTTITFNKSDQTIGTGSQVTFTATVTDQGGVAMGGEPVTWSVTPGQSVSPTSGVSTTFTAGTTPGGPYTITAVDGTANATVHVTVVANSMIVSCDKSTVGTGASANCTAVVNDPGTGLALSPQPTINWSIDAPADLNTITGGANGTAVFQAQTASATPYSVRATAPSTGDSAAFLITVSPTAPQIASVTPTVFVSSVSIAIQASVFGNHPLSYQCAVDAASPSSAITFPTTASASNDVIGTPTAANSFIAKCTVTDTSNGVASQKVSAVFTVNQVLKDVKVCATGDASCSQALTLMTLQNQQFTATGLDQFGNTMALSSVQWSNTTTSNGASASFSSPSLGQNIQITATSNGRSGHIVVNVISFDVSGAYAFPVPYKASFNNGGVIHFKGLGSKASIRIYTPSGRRVFDIDVTSDTYDWNIKNTSGENLASGVYFYKIESPSGKKDGKLIIIQ